MPTLVMDAISKRYREMVALHAISLTLQPGVTGLLGPNGAGKSSLIRIVATVARPTSGVLSFDGRDVLRDPNALRANLGYLPQDCGVYPQLTADEFLQYVAALKNIRGAAARRQIDELLEALNLTHVRRRPLGTFSGGMRQRVAIAQALLGDPAVIVADEPTVGLDPQERVNFRDLIRRLGAERIILLSTHIVSDLELVADRVVILKSGRIVADGTVTAIAAAHGSLEAAYLAHVADAA